MAGSRHFGFSGVEKCWIVCLVLLGLGMRGNRRAGLFWPLWPRRDKIAVGSFVTPLAWLASIAGGGALSLFLGIVLYLHEYKQMEGPSSPIQRRGRVGVWGDGDPSRLLVFLSSSFPDQFLEAGTTPSPSRSPHNCARVMPYQGGDILSSPDSMSVVKSIVYDRASDPSNVGALAHWAAHLTPISLPRRRIFWAPSGPWVLAAGVSDARLRRWLAWRRAVTGPRHMQCNQSTASHSALRWAAQAADE